MNIWAFDSITINQGNESFVIKNNGLFTADEKRLICIISKDDYYNGVYQVPEGTESIDRLYVDGFSLRIPKSVNYISDGVLDMWDLLLRSIIAPKGSYAIEFAEKNGFKYEIQDD